MHTPGHSDFHFVLHDERRRLLFAGDHLLLKITPNIGLWTYTAPRPLRRTWNPPGVAGLWTSSPGARPALSHDLDGRIDELLAHHEERLSVMLAALDGQSATPFEVARRVFPEDLTDHQLRFALAETLAHLEHLEGGYGWRTAWSATGRSNPVLANEEEHARLVETARGDRPADLLVRGGTIANVYSGELHEGNVAVARAA